MVVGVVDARGRRIVAYGRVAKDDKRPLTGDTIFEIGSITKVFTSLVLMDMVPKGEVSVTDPVSKYLPAAVRVPERNGKKRRPRRATARALRVAARLREDDRQPAVVTTAAPAENA